MKKIMIFFLIVLGCGLYFFYLCLTDGFKQENICFPVECRTYTVPNQDIAVLENTIHQPFSYLGKGRQCYVFESADGRWVIKFFKCRRLRLSSLYEMVAACGLFRDAIYAKREEKNDRRHRLFSSAYLVATSLYEEAGIAYFQLSTGSQYLPHVELVNKNGQKQVIDLNKTPFCLQRKGEHVFAVLNRLIEDNRMDEAKMRLDQLLSLLVVKRVNGVRQYDTALITRGNIGFLDDRAIFLDIGSFKRDNGGCSFHHERQQMQPLLVWLRSRNTDLATYFEAKVNAL